VDLRASGAGRDPALATGSSRSPMWKDQHHADQTAWAPHARQDRMLAFGPIGKPPAGMLASQDGPAFRQHGEAATSSSRVIGPAATVLVGSALAPKAMRLAGDGPRTLLSLPPSATSARNGSLSQRGLRAPAWFTGLLNAHVQNGGSLWDLAFQLRDPVRRRALSQFWPATATPELSESYEARSGHVGCVTCSGEGASKRAASLSSHSATSGALAGKTRGKRTAIMRTAKTRGGE
jgi:hypothetical protein